MAGKFHRQIDRGAGRDGLGEEPLDDSVLQGLVGHHHDAPADAQSVQGGRERTAQRVEFVVDRDPQGLERALGRMPAGAPGRGRNRFVEKGYQVEVDVNGSRARRRTMCAAMRRANRSSP